MTAGGGAIEHLVAVDNATVQELLGGDLAQVLALLVERQHDLTGTRLELSATFSSRFYFGEI